MLRIVIDNEWMKWGYDPEESNIEECLWWRIMDDIQRNLELDRPILTDHDILEIK